MYKKALSSRTETILVILVVVSLITSLDTYTALSMAFVGSITPTANLDSLLHFANVTFKKCG